LELRSDPIEFSHEFIVRLEDGTIEIAESLEILPNILNASVVYGVF